MKIVFFTIAFFILIHEGFSGGGWVNKRGELYLKVSQQWVNYDQYYSIAGRVINDRTRSIGNTAIYAEYGISHKFTGIIYFPFFVKTTLFQQKNSATGKIILKGESYSSIGDSDLRLKYGLIQNGSIVLSTSLTLGLPFGGIGKGSDQSLQTGDGEFNQMLRADFGTSFKVASKHLYLTGYFGLNNRTEGFSDELRYGLEVGVELGKIVLMTKTIVVGSLENETISDNLFFQGLLANDTEYLIVSLEIAYNVRKKWGISINYAKAISGKLIYNQPSYTAGIYFNI
ncbi:MAG: hypothetical protein ACJA2S_004501 [Cyclobacteriaceae bacterium]|jgi:hypothetical protein